jgi:putative membrane protein
MKAMTGDHEHDVAAFRAASKAATDAHVRAFASKTLPTLEEHLAEARRVEGQVGRGASAAQKPRAAAAGY